MFIGVFSFEQRLVKLPFSGSKAAHPLAGGTASSGSITTMKKILFQLETEPNICFANGNVDVFMDNIPKNEKEQVKQVESKKMAQVL